jgi:hypothetical protein
MTLPSRDDVLGGDPTPRCSGTTPWTEAQWVVAKQPRCVFSGRRLLPRGASSFPAGDDSWSEKNSLAELATSRRLRATPSILGTTLRSLASTAVIPPPRLVRGRRRFGLSPRRPVVPEERLAPPCYASLHREDDLPTRDTPCCLAVPARGRRTTLLNARQRPGIARE